MTVGPAGPQGPTGDAGPRGAPGPVVKFPDWLLLLSDYEQGDGDLAAFNRAHTAVPSGGTILLDRDGDYDFAGSLSITKLITIQGGNASEIVDSGQEIWVTGATGIRVNVGAGLHLRDVVVRYAGSNLEASDFHGIHANGGVRLRNVGIYGFPGFGVRLRGNAGGGEGNVNHSTLVNVTAADCGKSGFQTDGADANVMTFLRCTAERCGLRGVAAENHGFYDNSFLGNCYAACRADDSDGLDFVNANANARAVFSNCRTDGSSQLEAPAIAVGGQMNVTSGNGQVMKMVDRGDSTGWLQVTRIEWNPVGTLAANLDVATGVSNLYWNINTAVADPNGYRFLAIKSGSDFSYQARHSGLSARVAYQLIVGGYVASQKLILRSSRVSGGTLAERPTTSAVNDIWQLGDVWWNKAYAAATPFWWTVSAVDGGGAITWVDGPAQP